MDARYLRGFAAFTLIALSILCSAERGGAVDTFFISGHVLVHPSPPIHNALVSLGGYATLTWECGSYSLLVPQGTSGTLTAQKNGYSFASGIQLTDVQSDLPDQDLLGTRLGAHRFVSNAAGPLDYQALPYGMSPPSQTIGFTFYGPGWSTGQINWTATSDQEFIHVYPAAGSGPGQLIIWCDFNSLSQGTYTGQVTVSSPDCPQDLTVPIWASTTPPQQDAPPFGSFDTPAAGATVQGSIPVTGWALDDVGVQNVSIWREEGANQVFLGNAAFLDGGRPDIHQAYSTYPSSQRAGWGFMLLTHFLPNGGNGLYTIVAKASDYSGQETILGSRTITVDNAHAVKPFGAIDTPEQGGTASGSTYSNTGWVLTPQPNSIPSDGSTITVYVGGLPQGHPAYNVLRQDISSSFPGYANTQSPGGQFTLDATAFANGVHTIQWVAADNAGNTDGIGSRYFTIQNSDRSGPRSGPERAAAISVKGLAAPEGMVYLALEELCGATGGSDGGCVQVNGEPRMLPVGSHISEDGMFTWDPGPAVRSGSFTFEFRRVDQTGEWSSKSITLDVGEGAYVYYVPYSPASADFALGFGISNVGNASATDITVEYFDNNGALLGEDTATAQAAGHVSFMSSVQPQTSGWARITAGQPVEGMALCFGADPDPMFDMDFKSGTFTELLSAHVDTGNGWLSKAMLANPNATPANVTVTFHADSGATQTAGLTIPAMGAVQYDLAAAFPNVAGAASFASDQSLTGFLLYDGRGLGHNFAGGLSMLPPQTLTQEDHVYYVPYAPAKNDFALGFGISAVGNENATDIDVEYFSNNGVPLGHDLATASADGHASFMSSVDLQESGWARITTTGPVRGMALCFGSGDDPMFDMDFKSGPIRELTAAHVDTGANWASLAMLANPNESPANVLATFHADSGATQTANLTIPALGSVQYDLGAAFPGLSGSVTFASDQGLAGFILYDGRTLGNYVGGLSMTPGE